MQMTSVYPAIFLSYLVPMREMARRSSERVNDFIGPAKKYYIFSIFVNQ